MVKAINIDLRIYPISAIRYSVRAFRGVCGISLEETDESVICAFDCQNGDFEEIRDEFYNYLIYSANKKRRDAC